MIEELIIASKLLNSALDKYLDVCSATREYYLGRSSFPPELLSQVQSEACMLSTLETKLQKAKVAIHRTQNSLPPLVPIHALPRELLERIFLLVSDSQFDRDKWHGLDLKNRPEVLSHVCSRWRGFLLNLPSFWSVIRLPSATSSPGPIDRAHAFAERSSPLPVYLQLHNQVPSISISFDQPSEVLSFVVLISSRLCSLQAIISRKGDINEYYNDISRYITVCKPGVLKTLTTSFLLSGSFGGCRIGHFDSTDSTEQLDRITLVGFKHFLGSSTLSRVMESITNLRLSGLYPYWTSKAYHGLVELRLPAASTYMPSISERHLLGILRASPALRILEFDLVIVESESHLENSANVPVHLDCLESLQVGRAACLKLGSFVRWLFPGPRSLQLSLADPSEGRILHPLLDRDVTAFFLRSNITEVHAMHFMPQNIKDILNACSRLQTLALDGFKLLHDSDEIGYPIQSPHLESLYVLKCFVLPQYFFSNIMHSPTLRTILFWECVYSSNWGESMRRLQPNNLDDIVDNRFLNARVVDYAPTQEWSVFGRWLRRELY